MRETGWRVTKGAATSMIQRNRGATVFPTTTNFLQRMAVS